MMDWATVIDLRNLKNADVVDVIRINDRTLTIKIGDVGNEQEYQYQIGYLPEGIDEDMLLGEFAYRIKQINDTGAVSIGTLHVWDAVDGWLDGGEIHPCQYVEPNPKEQVLAIVDRIVAEKDEKIAALEDKWHYYNQLLTRVEQDRDVYRKEAGDYWNKWREVETRLVEVEVQGDTYKDNAEYWMKVYHEALNTLDERNMYVIELQDQLEEMKNRSNVYMQIIENLKNAMQLLEEV